MTVVGVIRDLKHYGVDREMRPGVYVPMAQRSVASMSIVVRTPLPPEKVIASARDVVRAMDPDLPVYETTTLTAQLERSLETRRLYAWVFGVFAAVALALTLGGVYGVLSYAVTERSHEIGIRMALGARQAQVVGLVLGRGITLVGIGAFFGLVGSAASAHVLSGLVHGVGARDPGTYALVTLALLAVAVLASVPPAWRASAVDPMRALRRE